MRLLYGTGNAAKVEYMRKVLRGLDIEIIGLKEAEIDVPGVEENGSDPLENACVKSVAYYRAAGVPVFSCDSGLYIEGLPEALQPGVNVRTVNGRRLTDDEMIEHYSSLVQTLGGQAAAYYQNAICLVLDGDRVYKYAGDDIASERFMLTSRPHAKRNAGFPLDSLSLEIKTGMYYFDLNEYGHIDTDHSEEEGFREFFKSALSQE